MTEQRSEEKRAFGRPMPNYVPCKKNADGKHKFERLTHNQFEKCMHCGEPRFALVDHSYRPEVGGWVR